MTAFANDQRTEAAKVTWWLEDKFYQLEELPTLTTFPTPPGIYEVERGDPEINERTHFVIVRINNDNPNVVGQAKMMMGPAEDVSDYSAGEHIIGNLRPGVTRFWACIWVVGESEGAWTSDYKRLNDNFYGKWLDFTDSKGYRWRRHADGTLEALNEDLKQLLT